MLHELMRIWFQWVQDWGYWGIIILMALESTVVPIPSEIILPPAAFWAAQGKLNFSLVVFCGALGSLIGSLISYYVALAVGIPVVKKWGRFFLLGPDKIEMGERWIKDRGFVGIVLSRLLPIVRHVISVPAGLLKMPVKNFIIATTVGSTLWCWMLSWFGAKVLGDRPELLNSPEELVHVLKAKMLWFVGAAVAFLVLYLYVASQKNKSKNSEIKV